MGLLLEESKLLIKRSNMTTNIQCWLTFILIQVLDPKKYSLKTRLIVSALYFVVIGILQYFKQSCN